MPIRPELLVRGLDGRPQPPQDLLARLQQQDPRLGLFYTKASWAITEAWRPDDPRREWIQLGQMQPEMAFDICGYLPLTCSLDEAPAYIARELRSYTVEQFQSLRAAVVHWNDVGMAAVQEDAVLSAVSNDLDRSNIVSPGISTPVTINLAPDIAPAPTKRSHKKKAASG